MTDVPADPYAVLDAMIAAGWHVNGGRIGIYARLYWPNSQRSTIIPLRPDFPDYADLMGAVLTELRHAAETGAHALKALAAINPDTTQED